MKPAASPVAVSSEDIPGPRHVCAFFESPEDEYRLLLPFARACERCGDRCFQFLEGARGADVPSTLVSADLSGWRDTYRRGGQFVIGEMLQFVRQTLEHGPGVPRTRAWGTMQWPVRNALTPEELAQLERRMDAIVARTDGIVICAYQVGRYDTEGTLGVLRAHPWLLVDGRLEENPVYDAGASA
jgi:hypothetical protein